MAARRYFRKGEADLPTGGAWTYRGTQVVTGAEARKVAAEQAAERRRAADELLRSRAPGPAAGSRQAFSHDPTPGASSRMATSPEPVARPASSRAASSAPVPPVAPVPTTKVEPGASLLGRVRRALGLG
jgi:hypothetical protein